MASKKIDPVVPAVEPVVPAEEIKVDENVTITVAPKVDGTEDSGETTQIGLITPEEEEAIIAAEKEFQAALAESAERVALEESIQDMSNEELHETFGFTITEAVGVLQDAITRSKSIHSDKMFDLLSKIEKIAQL